MTQLNRRPAHPTTADGRRARRVRRTSSREARARRSFDGVVASYLRELSAAGDAGQGSSSSITS